MGISPEVRAEAETALIEFCQKHSSVAGADRLRYTYEFATNSALLVEQRPAFMKSEEWSSKPMAKFRFSEARNVWSLYWSEGNDRWQRVSNVKADKDIRVLLQAVVKDPLGVFWS